MGFPMQEYWSGLPFPSPGDLPNLGTEPTSPALAGGFFTTESSQRPTLKIQIQKLSNEMWSESSIENVIILTQGGISLGGDMTVNNRYHEENYKREYLCFNNVYLPKYM